MTNSNLSAMTIQSLPALSGARVNYDEHRNLFVAEGWSSPSGNYYYMAYRCSNRLVLMIEVGIGYSWEFLNGLRLFRCEGSGHVQIGQLTYGTHDVHFMNDYTVKRGTEAMLKDYLKSQCLLCGQGISEETLCEDVKTLVDELFSTSSNRPSA